MSNGYDLRAGDRLDVFDKRRHVVGPLRPRVDVTARSGAVAVPAQVERVRAQAVVRHSLRETLVAAGVLTKPVHDGERGRAGLGPGAIGELRAVGRLDRTAGCGGALRSQGGRVL